MSKENQSTHAGLCGAKDTPRTIAQGIGVRISGDAFFLTFFLLGFLKP